MTIAKPVMRGLLIKDTKMNIITGVALSFVVGGLFKVLVADARKKKYAEFYKNYDAEADFERMKALGLFQSG